VKLCQLIAQEGEDGAIFCTCLVPANDDQDITDFRATCGGSVEDCQTIEISTVTDKDGNAFRPILLPQYRLEATVPESCYKEFGSDLDSCSRQESQGCQGCRVLREAKTDEA
jgi:hypothetical protein